MINRNIHIQPCSPQIGMDEPDFPVGASMDPETSSLESSTKSYLAPVQHHQQDQQQQSSKANSSKQKRNVSNSTNTSVDTDDELHDGLGALETSSEFDFQDQQASLPDSQAQRNLQNRSQLLSPNRVKKQKKKNRLTQIISGGNYQKKSEHFQKLFKNLNHDEKLIIDYSCAFYRDILVHGRLYLSQSWLCFYANIFGWETLITVQWTDVTAITKEKTAKVIPNAIQVLTDTDKFFFTTFVNRDNAYHALFRIWQNALLGHPMQPEDLKTVCKQYRQKKTGDLVNGEPVNYEHDETGDEINEDELTSTNGSNENLNKIPPFGSVDPSHSNGSSSCNNNPTNRTPDHGHSRQNSRDLDVNGHKNGDGEGSSGNNADVTVVDPLPDRFPHTGVPHSDSPQVNEDGRTSSSPPKKSSSNGFLNRSLGQEEAKEKIKNALKHGIPNLGTRSFTKASDLFRKKKSKTSKGGRNTHHRHSIHLAVPDEDDAGGETTTDFEEGDSDASNDNLLDEDVCCPCDSHSGTEYTNEEFNIDVNTLYNHLFSQESNLMKRVFEERKHQNWRYTALEDGGDHTTQTLTYTLNLNYSIGPKTSDTISKQIFPKSNKPGSYYCISTESRSVGVPYSDSFTASVQYCISRSAGNRSRLKVFGEIVYTKRVFGLVKNMISRNGDEAMRSYYTYLADLLKEVAEITVTPTKANALLAKRSKPKKKLLTKKASKEPCTKVAEHTQKRKNSNGTKPATTAIVQETSNRISNIPFSSTTLITFCIIIFLLLGMNMYVLRRLTSLEGNLLVSKRSWTPQELPNTKEEWKTLLDYQKNLHDLELLKLKEVIGNTAVLVRQVEDSISALYAEIDKNVEVNKLQPEQNKKEL